MNESQLQAILEKSGDVEKGKKVLSDTTLLLEKENILLTEPQVLSLASHLSAMVHRSLNGGEIPPIDKELFSEISEHSLELAEQVCFMLPNLDEGEKYLLSIHFESAKALNN